LVGGGDKIWWVSNRKGKFEVRSFYNEIISKAFFFFEKRLFLKLVAIFLGSAFGALKPRREWLSLFGQPPLARFLR
jgi:hypothetical protein